MSAHTTAEPVLNRRLEVGQEIADDTGEEAATEYGGADSSAGACIGNAYVTAARVFLDGHFRNDGDAHAGADHIQQAGELTALENDLGIDASAAAGGHGRVAKTVAIAQKQEGIDAEIGEGKRTARGELVTRRERGEEALGEQGSGFEFAASHGQSENGEIQSTGAKALEENGRNFFEDTELGLREFARKRGEARGKKIRRHRGNDADVDGAGD